MNLFDLFKQAQAKQGGTGSRPKLVFPTSDSQQIHVAVCSKANQPDFLNYLYLYLVENKQFPGVYLGKVTKKGELVLSPATFSNKDLRETCLKLFKEPQETCQIQGRRCSFCCFCGTQITSMESLTVGYGPICAEKWGLPWGEIVTNKLQTQIGQAFANREQTNHN